MATRTSVLEFRTSGAGGATGDVIKLSDALARQRQRTTEAAGALEKATASHQGLSLVVRAATEETLRFGSALGPVGVGLAALAAAAPRAAQGLLGHALASERASLASRGLNAAIMVGAGATAAAAAAGIAATAELVRRADAYQALSAKIKIYADGAVQAHSLESKLFAGAATARTSIDTETRLFSRLAPAVADTGRGPDQAVRLATLINKTLTIQGATGQEERLGSLDLIHALTTGNLGNRQMRGLQTEAPVLLRYIAENLKNGAGGFGVPYGELPELATSKKLSSSTVIDALMRAEPQINQDFEKAPKTAEQGWTVLNSTITRTVGELAQVTGAQKGLFDWLTKLTAEADAFRQKLITDPAVVGRLEQVEHFIGGAIGSIGTLGDVAVKHFDAIVAAGQLVIALKLGDIIGGWFAAGAKQALALSGTIQDIATKAKLAVGLEGTSPAGVQAYYTAKAQAEAMAAKATAQAAQADLLAARAATARAAAEGAAGRATALAAAGEGSAAAAAEAEAVAAKTAAVAKDLEAKASRVQAQAAQQLVASKAAAVIATEAELAATREVTAAEVIQAGALGALKALYTGLGGAVGIASLALGAVIYALWQENLAMRAELDKISDLTKAKTALASIDDQLATASEARIAQLRREREETLKDAEAELQLQRAKAGRLRADAQAIRTSPAVDAPGTPAGSASMANQSAAELWDRAADKIDQAVAKGEASLGGMRAGNQNFGYRADTRLNDLTRERVENGVDEAGNKLSPAQIAADRARLASARQVAAADDVAAHAALTKAAADYSAAQKSGDAARIKAALAAQGKATDLVDTADERLKSTQLHHRVDVPAENKPARGGGQIESALRQALKDIEQEKALGPEFADKIAGAHTYAAHGNQLYDATAGKPFQAVGMDQAKAVQQYLDMVREVEKATPKQLNKDAPGESRGDVLAALQQHLQYALATSHAAKASDTFRETLARLTGAEGEEGTKLEQVNRAIAAFAKENGGQEPGISAAARAWATLVDRVTEAKKALELVKPIYEEQWKLAEDTLPREKNPADPREAYRRLDQKRAMADAGTLSALQTKEPEALSNFDTQTAPALRLLGTPEEAVQQKRLALEQEYDNAIAAIRTQGETRMAEDAAKIQRASAEQRQQIEENLSKNLEGAVHDLIFGGNFKKFGQQVGQDFLEALYQELLANPIKKLVNQLVSSLFNPQGSDQGGNGGIFSGIFSFIGNLFNNPNSLPPFADGGHINGPGGPRDDKILAAVSNGEFIVNARSTARFLPVLDAINSGRVPHYADGGLVGPYGIDDGARASLASGGGGGDVHIHGLDLSIHAPGADRQGIADLREGQKALQEALVASIKNEPRRVATIMGSINRQIR